VKGRENEIIRRKFGRQEDGMTARWAKEHDVVGTNFVHRKQGMKENVGWNIRYFIQVIAHVNVGWKVAKEEMSGGVRNMCIILSCSLLSRY
jgi:hypothetical protein